MLKRLLERRFRYATLLACLLYTMAIDPLLPIEIGSELTVLLLFAAAFSVSDSRWTIIFSIVLGVPAVVMVWWLPQGPASIGHLIQAVFLVYVTALIHRQLLSSREVTLDTIIGSVAGFLLIAIAWSWIYMAIESNTPASFRGIDSLRDLTYFSFVTISSLGYGDIVPVSDPARMFSSLEAVFGQFYFAILVGRLISLYVESERRTAPAESDPE